MTVARATVTVCCVDTFPPSRTPLLHRFDVTEESLVIDVLSDTCKSFGQGKNPGSYSLVQTALPFWPNSRNWKELRQFLTGELPVFDEEARASTLIDVLTLKTLQTRSIALVIIQTRYFRKIKDLLTIAPDLRIAYALYDRAETVKRRRTSATPSESISNAKHIKSSYTSRTEGIFAGRPLGNRGPAVALFSPELAKFIADMDNLQLKPDEDLKAEALQLITLSADFYPNEDLRVSAIAKYLNNVIGNPDKKVLTGRAIADAKWGSSVVAEYKNEVGLHGDALLQAAKTYLHVTSNGNYAKLAELWGCPAVLIGINGTQLAVGAAIQSTHLYMDQIYLGHIMPGRDFDDSVHRLAQVLTAIKSAARALKTAYANTLHTINNLSSGTMLLPFFPIPVAQPGSTSTMPVINFTARMIKGASNSKDSESLGVGPELSCRADALYIADVDVAGSPKQCVVKFTRRYNKFAHEVLANQGLAPKLYHCILVQDRHYMVIMEKLTGKTVEKVDVKEMDIGGLQRSIRDAVKLLHDHDIVHGDLRSPNIMVTDHGVRILDFDWAGQNEKACYPYAISTDPDMWHPEVKPASIMKKLHNNFLVKKIIAELHERLSGRPKSDEEMSID
ncbi:hypothetical protein C8R43DRAFT_1141824 [Mycena crocata]|nr:hypothetical protein C8R43DRAFT_1141824 [Mycena crocata]